MKKDNEQELRTLTESGMSLVERRTSMCRTTADDSNNTLKSSDRPAARIWCAIRHRPARTYRAADRDRTASACAPL